MPSLSQKNIDKLVSEALAIEAESARDAGALGFMARLLVQITLPHRSVPGNEFVRTNGNLTVTMLAPSSTGLPFGRLPRLLLAWITTEAVRTNTPELVLGNSLSEFMRKLGLTATGGRWGSITRLNDQTNRLIRTHITCDDNSNVLNLRVAERAKSSDQPLMPTAWWKPTNAKQGSLWNSTLLLDQTFYSEIVSNPIPLDLRVLKALKAPMALDQYAWLTYRMSYLKRPTPIRWELLQRQFGANYPKTPRGKADFKRNFIKNLKYVQLYYPNLNLDIDQDHLILHPSPTHIPAR